LRRRYYYVNPDSNQLFRIKQNHTGRFREHTSGLNTKIYKRGYE